MKKYLARTVVTLPSGCVRIDTAQARTRAHNLTALEDGTHRIDRPIQFKAGERFEWDGEAPKAGAAEFGEVKVESAEMPSEETQEMQPAAARKKNRKFFV